MSIKLMLAAPRVQMRKIRDMSRTVERAIAYTNGSSNEICGSFVTTFLETAADERDPSWIKPISLTDSA